MKYTARAIFQANEVLRHVDSAELDLLARVATRRSYVKGERLYSAGDPGDAIFGIIAGEVQVTARTPDEHEIALAIVRSGEVLGEVAMIDGRPRLVTASAITPVEAFRIGRDHFMRLMLAHSTIMVGLIAVLCERQRLVTKLIIDEYSIRSVSARIASRILRLTGDESDDEQSLTMTQAQLAKHVFASRQVVNQHLSEWERNGWVSVARRRLTVNNREALNELAASNGQAKNGMNAVS